MISTSAGAASALDAPPPGLPALDTPVLTSRPLRPGTDPAVLPVFGDDRWDLTPAFFEDHIPTVSVNFAHAPAGLRQTAKRYLWQLLNCPDPPVIRGTPGKRLSVRTISTSFTGLAAFLHWLDARGLTRLDQVTQADLDAYLADLRSAGHSRDALKERITAVRRLWFWRDRLPAPDRLPQAPPWQGETATAIIGRAPRSAENRTPRIPAPVIDRLLLWSLRFVNDFAEDIIAVRDEYTELARRTFTARCLEDGAHRSRPPATFEREVAALLDRLATTTAALPGKQAAGGGLVLDRQHMGRLLNCPTHWLKRGPTRRLIAGSGLPVSQGAYLGGPVRGQIHGQPWRDRPITFFEAGPLLQHLLTAAFVLLSYLSGTRPGEALTLRRGCVQRDPVTGLWLLNGRKWKGAHDETGAKRPEGEQRADPWVVVEPVATAVSMLERLHDDELLFPTALLATPLAEGRAQDRVGKARTNPMMTKDIGRFITWVNGYCQAAGLDEQIPADPDGRNLAPSRFRRTLAWHIVRRPRGLVAAAIQYGHVHVQLTLGYSGTYASGFPDEHAFETWLLRLEQLTDAEHRLREGEHVSGPAAPRYRERAGQAGQRFAGRVLTSGRQVRDLLANPALQIYPGTGMTCVFDPAKAKCHLGTGDDDTRRTPDLSDCRPGCQNIARTDRDIEHIRRQAAELTQLADDPFSPAPRHERERRELTRLCAIIAEHDGTRPHADVPA